MGRDVGVALLEAVVLAHVVQEVASDDDRAHHLVLDHHAAKDASADGHLTGERTFLVDVSALDGLHHERMRQEKGIVTM